MVNLEWPHGNEKPKNLLNLKYFIPWVLRDKQKEISEKVELGRGDGEEKPITPPEIAKLANWEGKGGPEGTLLLLNKMPDILKKSMISQAKQILIATLYNDAVALTAMQVPVVIPDFPDMTNVQEIYDAMGQLVAAQECVLDEDIGLDAVKADLNAIRHLKYAACHSKKDVLNKELDKDESGVNCE